MKKDQYESDSVGQRLAGMFRKAWDRWMERRRLLSTLRMLNGLDEGTLKDIGFRRDEVVRVLRQTENAPCEHCMETVSGKGLRGRIQDLGSRNVCGRLART